MSYIACNETYFNGRLPSSAKVKKSRDINKYLLTGDAHYLKDANNKDNKVDLEFIEMSSFVETLLHPDNNYYIVMKYIRHVLRNSGFRDIDGVLRMKRISITSGMRNTYYEQVSYRPMSFYSCRSERSYYVKRYGHPGGDEEEENPYDNIKLVTRTDSNTNIHDDVCYVLTITDETINKFLAKKDINEMISIHDRK